MENCFWADLEGSPWYSLVTNIHIYEGYNFNLSGNNYNANGWDGGSSIRITSSSLGNIYGDTIQSTSSGWNGMHPSNGQFFQKFCRDSYWILK